MSFYSNNQNEWLLVKQNSEGLWPNLWTFPLLENLPDKVNYLKAFQHQLTHYQLVWFPLAVCHRHCIKSSAGLVLKQCEALG